MRPRELSSTQRKAFDLGDVNNKLALDMFRLTSRICRDARLRSIDSKSNQRISGELAIEE